MTYANRRMLESRDAILVGDFAAEVVAVSAPDPNPSVVTYQGQCYAVFDGPEQLLFTGGGGMTVLDDARRIAAAGPPTYEDTFCLLCQAQVVAFGVNPVYPAKPHRDDCPWLSMGAIVAALEAAMPGEPGP